MKAGGTGSIPGGATSKVAWSVALKELLNDIDSASFWLNTIVVGLDAVDKVYPQPDGLNVH